MITRPRLVFLTLLGVLKLQEVLVLVFELLHEINHNDCKDSDDNWLYCYSLVTNTDASPLAFDLTKEEKPSQLPCVAETQNQNFPEANTYITNPTRSKSPGKTIVRNTTKFGSAKTPAIVSNGNKKYNIHSAIDDFVLLRTGINSSSSCPRSMSDN